MYRTMLNSVLAVMVLALVIAQPPPSDESHSKLDAGISAPPADGTLHGTDPPILETPVPDVHGPIDSDWLVEEGEFHLPDPPDHTPPLTNFNV